MADAKLDVQDYTPNPTVHGSPGISTASPTGEFLEPLGKGITKAGLAIMEDKKTSNRLAQKAQQDQNEAATVVNVLTRMEPVWSEIEAKRDAGEYQQPGDLVLAVMKGFRTALVDEARSSKSFLTLEGFNSLKGFVGNFLTAVKERTEINVDDVGIYQDVFGNTQIKGSNLTAAQRLEQDVMSDYLWARTYDPDTAMTIDSNYMTWNDFSAPTEERNKAKLALEAARDYAHKQNQIFKNLEFQDKKLDHELKVYQVEDKRDEAKTKAMLANYTQQLKHQIGESANNFFDYMGSDKNLTGGQAAASFGRAMDLVFESEQYAKTAKLFPQWAENLHRTVDDIANIMKESDRLKLTEYQRDLMAAQQRIRVLGILNGFTDEELFKFTEAPTMNQMMQVEALGRDLLLRAQPNNSDYLVNAMAVTARTGAYRDKIIQFESTWADKPIDATNQEQLFQDMTGVLFQIEQDAKRWNKKAGGDTTLSMDGLIAAWSELNRTPEIRANLRAFATSSAARANMLLNIRTNLEQFSSNKVYQENLREAQQTSNQYYQNVIEMGRTLSKNKPVESEAPPDAQKIGRMVNGVYEPGE